MNVINVLYMILGLILVPALIFIPAAILDQLKRQGKAREEEALRITALLQLLAQASNPKAKSDDTSVALQAAIDRRLNG